MQDGQGDQLAEIARQTNMIDYIDPYVTHIALIQNKMCLCVRVCTVCVCVCVRACACTCARMCVYVNAKIPTLVLFSFFLDRFDRRVSQCQKPRTTHIF